MASPASVQEVVDRKHLKKVEDASAWFNGVRPELVVT
jgi:hypothetical protein